ncbi:MAG: D-alanine--D-alanine ligase, partial [Erysipelotrichaceae bacterium]
MNKIKVAVLFGGHSSEYSVSLHSVASLLHNINQERYEILMIGISQAGDWYAYAGDLDSIEHDTWLTHPSTKKATLSLNPSDRGIYVQSADGWTLEHIDVVFPMMHGRFGEDGTLQGALQMAQLPYVGCNTVSSAMAMDKHYTHVLCEAAGIKMAPYHCVLNRPGLDWQQTYSDAVGALGLPLFIKPANAGSSYGISKIDDYESFVTGLRYAFEHDEKVLLEQAISGFEVGCAVLGNQELTVGEVDEIETHRAFFDFEGKYAMSDSKIHCPARIAPALRAEIQSQA